MADEKVIIELEIDGKTVKAQLGKIENQAETSGKKAGDEFADGFKKESSRVGDIFKGVIAANIATGAARAAVSAARSFVRLFGESIQAAGIQEEAVKALNASLEQTGQFSETASRDIQNFASSLQAASRFGDEAVLSNAALIQSIGQLDTETLKRATQAAADFAAATGRSLDEASQLVAKAAAGQASALSRYGIVVQKGKDDTETFSNALTVLESKFGGRAAKDVDTFSGRVQQLSNTWGDLLEEFGKAVTESPVVVSAIGFITKEIQGLIASLSSGGGLQTRINDLLLGTANFARGVIEFVVTPIRDAFNGLNVIFQAAVVPIKAVSALLGGGDIQSGIQGFTSAIDDVGLAVDNAFGETSLTKIDDFLARFTEQVTQISETTKVGNQEQVESIKNTQDNLKKGTKNAVAYGNILVNSVSQSMQALGRTLVTGGNFFQAFLGIVLNTLGDLLIQFGTAAIGIGIAAEGLKASIVGLTGIPAFVAGAAAIAAGAAIKSYAGSLGAPATNVASPGTSTVAGGTTEFAAPDTTGTSDEFQEERQEEQRVQVVVNGDVFDSQETGLRLVDILNQSFETNGTRLVTA